MTTQEWRALCPHQTEKEAVRKAILAANLPNLGWLNGAPQFPEGFTPDWDAVEAIARRAVESLSCPPPETKPTQLHKPSRKKQR